MNLQAKELISSSLMPGSLEQLAASVDGTLLQLPTGDALQQVKLHCEEDMIMPWTDVPERHCLFRINGEEVIPTSELSVVCGKAKSGKTLFSSLLIAAGLTPTRSRLVDVERIDTEPLRMLWFDTEQSRQSSKEILCQRILPLARVPPEAFDPKQLLISNTTVRDCQMRLQELILQVLLLRPQFVVVDGIIDLISSINDEAQARLILQQLRALARHVDCAMHCVIHQNKAAEDNTPRGWVGTEAINKCFEIWEAKKNVNTRVFTATLANSRGGADPEPMSFSMENNLPVSIKTADSTQTADAQPLHPALLPTKDNPNAYWRKADGSYDLMRITEVLIPEGEKVRSSLFFKQIMNMLKVSLNTAIQMVDDAQTEHLVTKMIVTHKEVYYCRYLSVNELPDMPLI